MRHEPMAALFDMLSAARRAVERLGPSSEIEFAENTDQQWVLFSQIVLIGEAANRVSAGAPSWVRRHSMGCHHFDAKSGRPRIRFDRLEHRVWDRSR
jgi:hypothetical protein